MANVDSALALTLALFVNAAILIVAAAVFHRSGHFEVAAIEDAYKLLSPLVGAAGASTLFAVALLASGQNSSITGTLAGQVVMEGFIHLRVAPWLRRLITRSIAIIPTIVVVAFRGEHGTEKLLLLSQVILSLQLSFAVVPLVMFTSNRKMMGEFVNAPWLKTHLVGHGHISLQDSTAGLCCPCCGREHRSEQSYYGFIVRINVAAVPSAGFTKCTSAGSRRGVSTEKTTSGLSMTSGMLCTTLRRKNSNCPGPSSIGSLPSTMNVPRPQITCRYSSHVL